jgi:hypothetical protein
MNRILILLICLSVFSCKKKEEPAPPAQPSTPITPPPPAKKETYGRFSIESHQRHIGTSPKNIKRISALFLDKPSDRWDTVRTCLNAGVVKFNNYQLGFNSSAGIGYASLFPENYSLDSASWKVTGNSVTPVIGYTYNPVLPTLGDVEYLLPDSIFRSKNLDIDIQLESNGKFDYAAVEISEQNFGPSVKKKFPKGQTKFSFKAEELAVIPATKFTFSQIFIQLVNDTIVNISGKDFLIENSQTAVKTVWVKN